MADQRGPRKHKWSTPQEMSPSKYLRGLDSKLPRGAQGREQDSDSPSPPRERNVRLYPYESTPKRTLDLRFSSNSMKKEWSANHRRTFSFDLERSDQQDRSTPSPRASVSLREGDRQLEMDEDTKTKSDAVPRSRERRPHAPSLLFKRAFSDIGVSARGRRSLDGEVTSPPTAERRSRFQRRESEDSEPPPRTDAYEKETVEEKPSWRLESAEHPRRLKRTITRTLPKEGLEVRKEESKVYVEEEEIHKEKPEAYKEKLEVRKVTLEAYKEKPETRMEKFEAYKEKPETRKEKLEAYKEKPEARKEKLEAYKEKPEAHKERSEAYKEKPETRKERSEAYKEKPEARKERLEAYKEKPEARKERLEAYKEKPETRKERSEAYKEKPEARKERLEAYKEKPETRKEKLEAHKEKPEAHKERLEAYKKKPETRKEEPEAPRLVFLYESDKESDPGDDPEKNPSIGSDFSDMEDVGALARFSQEDAPPPGRSVEDSTSGASTPSYVAYPRHLFNNSWSGCSDQWSSSPVYKPSAEQNKWRQDVLNKSCVSEVSFNTGFSHNTSFDSESEVESRWDRSGSFDTLWTSDNRTRTPQRTLEKSPTSYPNTPKSLRGGFIDTHCHLDMLFSRLQHKRSFSDLRKQYASTFPSEFQGCITDYCDPRTLERLPWRHVLNENLVWGAFGCHPHFAQYYTDQLQEEMMQALRHPKAIAYGEMGLDYSHKCSTTIQDQHAVFEKQLKLAVPLGKPLVIHCRDADEDLFRIMKKWVPSDYKIHRHCFTGSYKVIEPYLKEFPNMSVGFTAVLTYPSASCAREAVTGIPLDRLIVETDAPFFVPRQVPKSLCKFSHPGLALHTVEEIARIKNLPVKSVMEELRENTRRLYNI